ncbi:TPA: Ankyrin repeat [Trebouxia sp. C0005]
MGNEQSSPLQQAAAHDDIDKVHALVAQNRIELNGTDKDGWTPLHFASYWGSHKVMKELLELGARTDAQDKRMRTPLHLAALQGDAASVMGLCTYKAKVNLKDEHALTPLHKAAAQGHNEAAEELLSHNANPNATDEVGTTPAHLAAKRGHAAVIKLLFIRGADCRLARTDGYTPLHEAAAAGHTEAAKVLLSIGATPDVTDKNGHTPRDLAQKAGHMTIVRLLAGPDTYQQNLNSGLHGQGVSTSRSQGVRESESDVKYPTLHKPGQNASKAAPAVAAADPDSAEVQYPGIYKPNKKKIDSGTVSALSLLGPYTELRASVALTHNEKELSDGLQSAFENIGSLASDLRAKGPSGDKDWWAQKTNPSFPSAPIADSSTTTSTSSAASGPKQNPFLKGGSQEETKVRDAPVPGSKKQTGDQKNPRKEFEAGLVGAAQGVFSFFNKPGQKGQQGARRTPQANSSHAKEEDTRGVNEDWGNQQAREGEFRVPHQEQSNLDPYTSPQSSEEEVRYPTIGQRKPAAAKASKADISKELEDLEMEVQGSGSRRR